MNLHEFADSYYFCRDKEGPSPASRIMSLACRVLERREVYPTRHLPSNSVVVVVLDAATRLERTHGVAPFMSVGWVLQFGM
jgi:hypothetical protein